MPVGGRGGGEVEGAEGGDSEGDVLAGEGGEVVDAGWGWWEGREEGGRGEGVRGRGGGLDFGSLPLFSSVLSRLPFGPNLTVTQ